MNNKITITLDELKKHAWNHWQLKYLYRLLECDENTLLTTIENLIYKSKPANHAERMKRENWG